MDVSVLVVDDDLSQLELLKVLINSIKCPDCKLYVTQKPAEALDILKDNVIDIVITDYYMPDFSGLELLKKIKDINPLIKVIVITAFEKTSDAVEVMKHGADDYLLKPVKEVFLSHVLLRLSETIQFERENLKIKEQIEEKFGTESIIFDSPQMTDVLNTAARGADSNATVLITGESGTGKELVAQLIHHTSRRSDKPFVTVNVAALPENLVESEMFGHKKGAFTGAIQDRMGRFEEADGGTLFIDEIGEISPVIQVKLLRVLQAGEIERVGENRKIKLDVRIIAATNRNLEEMIDENEFRRDLYYRLNVIALNIPALRDRKTDIPPLVDYFIKTYSKANAKNVRAISREAMDMLMKYHYPGNVRELENIIARALIMCRGDTIQQKDLPSLIEEKSGTSLYNPQNLDDDYDTKLSSFESAMIKEALELADGNQSAAARQMGISERRLRSRLEKLGIDSEKYK